MLRTKQTHIESIYKHKVKLMSVGCECQCGIEMGPITTGQGQAGSTPPHTGPAAPERGTTRRHRSRSRGEYPCSWRAGRRGRGTSATTSCHCRGSASVGRKLFNDILLLIFI